MPNNLVLAKNYTGLLDEVYKAESKSTALNSGDEMMRAGANVNEIIYPQISVTGLSDYDRVSGYKNGSVTLEWKTTKFNYDRGTKLMVDTMDDNETFNLAFGRAGAELIRAQVAPEADAFTFAEIAGKTGINSVTGTYADASAFLKALTLAKNTMDEAEVPENERMLFATPTLMNSLMALQSIDSREAINWFSVRVLVPQSRFYTGIELLDVDISAGTKGGYKKSAAGTEINFMIVHKPAIIKFDKHIANDIIRPENNPNADSFILKYRKYGLVDVYENKVNGIYMSAKARA